MGIPIFEDAVVAFQRFLRREGVPEAVQWLFRGDVVKIPELAVRIPLPATHRDVAKDVFEHARARGLGVALNAVCRIGSSVGAIVEAPDDEQDASQRMFFEDSLKLSIGVKLPAAIEIRNRFEWKLRTLLHRRWDLIPPRPSTRLATARVSRSNG